MATRQLNMTAPHRAGNSESADDAEIHVLVVDDDERLRNLLQRYLTEEGFLISTAANASEARDQMARFSFDLVILDVMMPGQSGLDLTRELRTESQIPILLLTARGESEDRISGFESGADDYMPKPFEPRELVLRMHSILRRAAPLPGPEPMQAIVRLGDFVYDSVRGLLHQGDTQLRLTTGEQALLRELAGSPNVPVSREDLASRCEINSARAVDVQITRLRRKIEREPREPHYIQTIRGTGYMLVPE